MIGVSILCPLLFMDQRLNRVESGLLFAGIMAYTAINVIMARRKTDRDAADEFAGGTPHLSRHILLDLLWIGGGLVLLVKGARLLVDSAVQLARIWEVPEAVIGLTIVAAGTSLPELATSVVAAVRKQDDIAIGNIVGSNVFNILAILGAAGLVIPFGAGGVGKVDYGLMIGTAVLLLPLMLTGMRLGRREGFMLLCLYTGYLWWLWP